MEIRHLALSFQRPFSLDHRRRRRRRDDDFPPFFFSLAFRLSSTGRESSENERSNLQIYRRFASVLRIAVDS